MEIVNDALEGSMKISLVPARPNRGCNECLKKNIPLFTVDTVVNKLALCEACMKEAVIAVTQIGIKAKQLNLTHQ